MNKEINKEIKKYACTQTWDWTPRLWLTIFFSSEFRRVAHTHTRTHTHTHT